jgi:glutamyl-tRNA synthetase
MTGRYAPSPTGRLHLGNLRTAVLAWLFARGAGSSFLVRIEDLDPQRSKREHEQVQLDDLRAVGLDWDGPVVRQSERRAAHDEAIARLRSEGRTYECWCTRAEIREAASAAHGDLPEGSYPGTCKRLTEEQRREREREGRPPALRLDAQGLSVSFDDRVKGTIERRVDDFVLERNDGTPAYNLAVVVDDHDQRVEEVVRGDDLIDSTPRQILVQRLLGLPEPGYAHVPLVLGEDGRRLAKRHGAVTLEDLTPGEAIRWLAGSLGFAGGEPRDWVSGFAPGCVPKDAVTYRGE